MNKTNIEHPTSNAEHPMPDQPPPLINEALAKKKFSCSSCGAEARWDPAKKALVCPYCGTVSPARF